MKNPVCFILILSIALSCFFCGTIPSDSNNSGDGSLRIIVWVSKSRLDINTRETTWSKLVAQISAADIGTIHDTLDLTTGQPFYSFTIEKIPAGDDRLVEAWTIDDENDTIHGVEGATVTIEPAKTEVVPLALSPIKGSIYAVLTDIPTIIDSVEFSFITPDIAWKVKAEREPKLNLCLDKIPYGTTGTLSIVGYDTLNDTVASWEMENFTFDTSNTTIQASFISVGKIVIQVTIHMPGVTIIVGIMDTTDSIGDETGGLIITEIMYAANDSEYVELYNPAGTTFDDTIILQKDVGTFRYFYVVIPPQSFFVIGRDSLPWSDTYHSTQSALDLSSTIGNWITIRLARDSSIIDNVAFQSGSNEQEWPNFSSSANTSIVLDSLPDDPEYNNFGRNWIQAESYIDTTITKQRGTPGESGS